MAREVSGSIIKLKPSFKTADFLVNYSYKCRIPNFIDRYDHHLTLIRTMDKVTEPANKIYDSMLIVPRNKLKLAIFHDTLNKRKVLSILVDSPEIRKRHQELADKYKSTLTAAYRPHINLTINLHDKYDQSKLKAIDFDLYFYNEVVESLSTKPRRDLHAIPSSHGAIGMR